MPRRGADSDAQADEQLRNDVRAATSGDPERFVEALRRVEGGNATCTQAGLPNGTCYEDGRSYTVTDRFDVLMLQLGRRLKLDTLFFTATFARPRLSQATSAAAGEIVDLRQAMPLLNEPSGSGGLARRAQLEVEAVQQQGRLSLRDPLRPERPALACNFSEAPTLRLACPGHLSWGVRQQLYEDRWDCTVIAE